MIIGFECKEGKVLFSNCPCSKPCRPLAYLHMLRREITKEHAIISVTSCLGCLMKSYIMAKNDVYIKLESAHANSFRGSLVHSALAEFNHNGDLKEEKLLVDGISGTPDYYEKENKKLLDWKTCKGIIPEKVPYSNHREQVLAYKFMLEVYNYPVKLIDIFYISFSDTYPCPIGFDEKECSSIWNKVRTRADKLDTAISTNKTESLPEPSVLCNGRAKGGKIYCWVKNICDRMIL